MLQAEQGAQTPKHLDGRTFEMDGLCDGDSCGAGESVNVIKYVCQIPKKITFFQILIFHVFSRMSAGATNTFTGTNTYLGKGIAMHFWLSVPNKKVLIPILFISS